MEEWSGSSILLIRLSSLGDIARLLPAARAVKSAGFDRMDLTVEDRFLPFTRLFPIFDEVISYPRKEAPPPFSRPLAWGREFKDYIAKLKSARYDIVLDVHGIVRAAVVASLCRAGRTIGYGPGCSREMSHHFYGETIVLKDCISISRYERYAGAVEHLGISDPTGEFFSPAIGREAEIAVDAFLEERDLERGGYFFAFVGASRAQAIKRWPLERFVEFATEAWRIFGIPTVLGWGFEERGLLDDLESREYLHPIPDWGLEKLVAVIAGARAFIGGDTGAMHLAALTGVSTLAIYGPTDPIVNRPFGDRYVQIVGKGVDRACSGTGCSHERCMGKIEAPEVLEALGTLMGKGLRT